MGKGEIVAEVLTKLGSRSLFPTAREENPHNLKNNKITHLDFLKQARAQLHKSGKFYSFFAWWKKKVLCPVLSETKTPARVENQRLKNPYSKKGTYC